MLYELSTYRGIHLSQDADTIQLFHHHQRLIKDSKEQRLDPFPNKGMTNLGDLIGALNKTISVLLRQR